MPRVCSDLVRFFRTLLPLLPLQRDVSSHPSVLLRHSYGRDKSSSSSSPSTSYASLRRRETSRNRFIALRSIIYRNYNCERSIDKMSHPARDPASEQLNEYKRNLKVRDCYMRATQLQRCSNDRTHVMMDFIFSKGIYMKIYEKIGVCISDFSCVL